MDGLHNFLYPLQAQTVSWRVQNHRGDMKALKRRYSIQQASTALGPYTEDRALRRNKEYNA